MQINLTKKITSLAVICVSSCVAGVIYQLINEKHLDHNSVLVGLPLGLVFGILELYLFPKAETRFRQWSFTKIFFFKTLLYTAIIYIVTLAIAIVIGWFERDKWSSLPAFISSREQLVLVLYALVIYGLFVFFMQINQLLGEGVLWKFILGKYHKPREEERIFMFLDMKSSTTIAEQLGHVRFYTLLNELFHEISQPVLQTEAEIYQYVGDEVVLTWEVEPGLKNSNCIKSFFLFQEILHRKSEEYLKDFGVRPAFKAGLHFGKIVSAQIGDLKREIVYNGDVLNTTARIRDACSRYGRDCLVSGALVKRLQQMNGFRWEWIDTVMLRGKETEVDLFSVVNVHE